MAKSEESPLTARVVGGLLIALILGGVEMRVKMGQQSSDLQNLINDIEPITKTLHEVKDEQLRRKDVIDWVREYRQQNNWIVPRNE